MKLTTILIVVASLQVAAKGHTQENITLSEKNTGLIEIFKKIERQTDYFFVYRTERLNQAKKVSIEIKNATLREVLETVLKDQPLTYEVVDKTIVIKPKEKSPNVETTNVVAPIDVSGKVTDKEGNPLVGANVKVKGTNIGTTTDGNGYFELKGVDENTVLEISFVGYETKAITVKNRTNINIDLAIDVQDLIEVIVNKGYYSTSQKLNTGNVSKVTSETIQKQPIGNPLAALEGRVPGLFIIQNSGIPGSTFNVLLRGRNSIASGTEPLFVIDGIPLISSPLRQISNTDFQLSPFNNLNPSDIESIEVLKDADATAIYGSRGANGVVLITTKKGKAGKTKVDMIVYSGIGSVGRKIDVLNTQQYLMMRREAFKNDNMTPTISNAPDLLFWDTTMNTDWQKLLIGGTAKITNGQISFSGGNSYFHFLLSGNYRKETTVYPGDYKDEKGSFYLNLNYNSLNKKFSSSIVSTLVSDRNNLGGFDFTNQILLPPNTPSIYDSSGKLNWANNTWDNPLGLSLTKYNTITSNLINNGNFQYEIIPRLKIKTSIGLNHVWMKEDVQVPGSSTNPNRGIASFSEFGNNQIQTLNIEPQIDYSFGIGKGILNVIIGSTFQKIKIDGQAIRATGFSNEYQLNNIQAASSIRVINNNFSEYHYIAGFGRLGYNFNDKYVVNLTARRDGSSRFGPGKQFANFGAIGAAWIFSKETFIENNLKFLSWGKVRGSYGTAGNDQIGNYQFLDNYSSTIYPYQNISGLYPNRLLSTDYAWETNRKLEVGIDLGVLKDKISLSASYYRNRSSNQLVGVPLPATTGFTFIQANLPAVVQNSGFEMEVNSINIKNENLSWTSSINVTIPRNKLISYPGLAQSVYANTYVEGQPLSIIRSYHVLGVDTQTGLYQIEDVDKNGNISSPEDYISTPVVQKYYGGISNSIRFQNFEFDFFFQFVKQNGINSYLPISKAPGQLSNQLIGVVNRWQKTEDISITQKFTSSTGNTYLSYNNALPYLRISDASYLRLKNISLSYQIPSKWLKSVHFTTAKIYFEGQNLFTITNYNGLDPENQYGLPPLRILTGGFQLSF